MECPKCGSEQDGTTECLKCGIIFAKFLKRAEEAEKKTDQVHPEPETQSTQKRSLVPILAFGATLLVIAGAVGFWLGSDRIPPGPDKDTETNLLQESRQLNNYAQNRQASQNSVQQSKVSGWSQQSDGKDTVSAIERARQATVFISSPWGSGSGFFIDSRGHIVTNRHVVQVSPEKLASLKANRDKLQEDIENENKSLRFLEKEFPKITRQDVRQQLERQYEIRTRNLAKAMSVYKEFEQQISAMSLKSDSDIKVTLLDGSQYSVSSINLSQDMDLALLSVYINDTPYIKPSSDALEMSQGEKVYTIGNPSGLNHTVTSGIISGYRRHNGKTMIQTDAPINPGNSGGPLIDQEGKVIGVNSKILTNTEGIGFAIPITYVEKEFSFYIQR
ncbi:MAG: trypsin-like peptidase domain-containing protein [Proteobacteria bacterium]|nr:trypsin-like peptidase domain-containing protein [Pseudomonadota bacterium]MBU1739334.1 trypsin-like peptidase domain-containing protein [Pseudomonadota bacterium]